MGPRYQDTGHLASGRRVSRCVTGRTRKEERMATLVELRCEIGARMQRGASFSSIEDDVIETSGLSADQKSALWLYGWSFVALDAQRREADAHIVQIAATKASRDVPRPGLRLAPSPVSR